MSLDLRDIERGVGADLLRRPILAYTVNATILRFYIDTISNLDDDEDELEVPGCMQQNWVRPTIAAAVFILTHIVMLVGFLETIVWFLIATLFKFLRGPKIYAFEKLLLDVRVLISRRAVRHIVKTVVLQSKDTERLLRLSVKREGFGSLVITTISCEETTSRDALALLRLCRYMNKSTIAFWKEDYVVLVGLNKDIVEAVCNNATAPAKIDLGWHRDILEQTNFKMSVVFVKDTLPPSETCIKSISRRFVEAEIVAEATTENLELLVECMDQFAAVCEARERGRRFYNGKRVSIYGLGILISLALIVRYEGLNGLVKPSADVLTLAVGAYTLWMTLGKSAALGETEEITTLEVAQRTNVVLAFHGLAKIENNVENTCWVPEIYREVTDEIVEGPMVDGSISKLEAAIYLSIFEHFGHLVKWKGPRLSLYWYETEGEGLGHIKDVKRIRNVTELVQGGNSNNIERIGAPKGGCPQESEEVSMAMEAGRNAKHRPDSIVESM